MRFGKITAIGLLVFIFAGVDVHGAGYRVVSDYPEIDGIYNYWGQVRHAGSSTLLLDVYQLTGQDYYIGNRRCVTKWVIVKLIDGPTPGGISSSEGDGTHIRNLSDVPTPPRNGWIAGAHMPGVERGTALNVEVIPVYDLTITSVGTGSVTRVPGTQPYDENTIVSLTAHPAVGWGFSAWSGDLTATSGSTEITMDADKAVTATFTELGRFALVVATIGSGSVTPPGGSYYDGDCVTLTAVPDDEYWQFDGWSGDLSGTAVSATLEMNATCTVTATFSLKDSDGDGLSDRDEDAGAHDGDGNRDGTRDSLQGHVVCLKTHDGQYQVTLESGPGTTLSACSADMNPHAEDCPDWAEFPYGFFGFTITGLAPGGATTLTLHLPDGQGAAVADTYYKYGPLPHDRSPQWYRFKYENSLQVGALFNGTTVSIHLIDGAMGDDDLTADGTIQDVGGPGTLLVTAGNAPGGPTPANDGGGGGGGCLIDVVRN